MSIYDVLALRSSDLAGQLAFAEDVIHLERLLRGEWATPLIRVHRELRVGNIDLEVVIEEGNPRTPGPDFRNVDDDFVREQEHALCWLSAASVVEGLLEFPGFQAAYRAGFVPIADCNFGGDPYFVRADEIAAARQSLWRIYLPGTDCDGENPVPEDALGFICDSLEDVIRVANIEKPYV